jgi:hypothetical protein
MKLLPPENDSVVQMRGRGLNLSLRMAVIEFGHVLSGQGDPLDRTSLETPRLAPFPPRVSLLQIPRQEGDALMRYRL